MTCRQPRGDAAGNGAEFEEHSSPCATDTSSLSARRGRYHAAGSPAAAVADLGGRWATTWP